jgi:hypothetical protein
MKAKKDGSHYQPASNGEIYGLAESHLALEAGARFITDCLVIISE